MATITKGKTFTNGETVTPQKLHELVDLGAVSGIVNADIAAGAAISDSKLAQITTAGKVANTATTATSSNAANAIVSRDAGGSFTAGTITAALSGNAATATTAAACSGNAATATTAAACSGNAATATTLQTARTINGVSFNGSGNITVTAAPNAHTHAISDTTGLQAALDGKQAAGSYAPATGIAPSAITGTAVVTTDSRLSDARTPLSHSHSVSDVTGLQTALDAKQASGSYVVTTDARLSDARTPTSHTHDDRYYTEAEMNTLLAGKQASGSYVDATHTHDDRYYTETEMNTLLAGKQASLNNASEIRLLIDSGSGVGQEGIDLFYGYENPRIFINSYGSEASPYLEFGVAYTKRGSITRNTAGTAVAYNTTSDYRLKTNLEPLTDAVARLLQIPVHRFNWLADPDGGKVDGFLAHEAQAIVPESVTGHKDEVDAEGKPIHQGIDQSKLVPLLVAAVQELSAEIAALKSGK